MKRRIITAMSGASGAILGVRLLQALSNMEDIESHLIISDSAKMTIKDETGMNANELQNLAHVIHRNSEVGATVASGSFMHHGMFVVPCSIKTLSAIANCYSSELISRAADVTLKEGRPLLLAVRETPFHLGHLELMTKAVQSGAILFPPMPAFYAKMQSVDDMIDQLVGRMLARVGIENDLYQSWQGLGASDD